MPNFLNTLDMYWLALNGLVVDVDYVLSEQQPRKPLSLKGTFKVEPTLIPGTDFKLNRVLAKYGGWSEVMNSVTPLTDGVYEQLAKIGFSRVYIDSSRAYIQNPTIYTAAALSRHKKLEHSRPQPFHQMAQNEAIQRIQIRGAFSDIQST